MVFCSQKRCLIWVRLYCATLSVLQGYPLDPWTIFPSDLAFRCWNILAPYLLCDFNVLDYHWTVLDLVSVNNPLVLIGWKIYDFGVESPSILHTLDLSLCETLYFLRDGVNKIEVLIPWVKLVQNPLMNSELHVLFSHRLSMSDEHNLVAPVGDEVLET